MEVVVYAILLPAQWVRMLMRRCSRPDIDQWMAWSPVPKPDGRVRILIHAVSVGEWAAAEAIIGVLLIEKNNLELILSSGNHEGMAAARKIRQRHPQVGAALFSPWDRRNAIRAWLFGLRPRLVVIIETELWPNLYRECRDQGIALAIVNGRVYARDVWRYRLIVRLMRETLECVDWIGVQDENERERFLKIGARPATIQVAGNCKYDTVVANYPDTASWLEEVPRLLVAGSTHAPEEFWILDAFKKLRAEFPDLRIVFAPRHVTRAQKLAKRITKLGLRVTRWSQPVSSKQGWDVLLIDELGHLAGLYRYATVVLIGGSWVDRGGHNPIEAAWHRRAIVTGPHMKHFQSITEDFEGHGALIRNESPKEILSTLRGLLQDPARCETMGQNAQERVKINRGSAHCYARKLLELVQ